MDIDKSSQQKLRELLEYRAQAEAMRQHQFENAPPIAPFIRSAKERHILNDHRQHIRHCLQILDRHTRNFAYTKEARAALQAEYDKLTLLLRNFDRGIQTSGQDIYSAVDFLERLPSALVDHRLRHGLSQTEIARRIGVSQGTLSSWEKVQFANVTLAKLLLVARAIADKSVLPDNEQAQP